MRTLCRRCLQSFDGPDRGDASTWCTTCRDAVAPDEAGRERSSTRLVAALAARTTLPASPTVMARMLDRTMLGRVRETLEYPFAKGSRAIFAMAVVFAWINLGAAGLAPGILRLMSASVLIGLLCTWFMVIIRDTTFGRERLSLIRLSGAGNAFDEVLTPVIQSLGVVALCLAPAPFLYGYLVNLVPAWLALVPSAVVLALGMWYLPMSLLAVAVFGGVHVILPSFVVPAIRAVGRDYFVVIALLLAVLAVGVGLSWLVVSYVPVFLDNLFLALLLVYLIAILGRFIGLVYYDHQAELGWARL